MEVGDRLLNLPLLGDYQGICLLWEEVSDCLCSTVSLPFPSPTFISTHELFLAFALFILAHIPLMWSERVTGWGLSCWLRFGSSHHSCTLRAQPEGKLLPHRRGGTDHFKTWLSDKKLLW